MKFATWAMISACLLPLAAQAAVIESPAVVEQQIKSEGATKTVAALSADGRWDAVLNKVEHGESQWLKVAAALRSGTDAGTSESLDAAVSGALQNNPAAVLKLFDHGINPQDVCRNRMIEPTSEQVKTFQARTEAAVRAVKISGLAGARDKCLSVLTAS